MPATASTHATTEQCLSFTGRSYVLIRRVTGAPVRSSSDKGRVKLGREEKPLSLL